MPAWRDRRESRPTLIDEPARVAAGTADEALRHAHENGDDREGPLMTPQQVTHDQQ